MKAIEPGIVLELNNSLFVNANVVYAETNVGDIEIGTISDKDMVWFSESVKTDLEFGEGIVYLGNFKFGVKQLKLPIIEFKLLDENTQNNILCEYLELKA